MSKLDGNFLNSGLLYTTWQNLISSFATVTGLSSALEVWLKIYRICLVYGMFRFKTSRAELSSFNIQHFLGRLIADYFHFRRTLRIVISLRAG